MAPGVTYTWSVTGGAGQVLANGGCINVMWGFDPGKSVTVTATDAAGCTTTTTLNLKDCDINPGECCKDFRAKTDLKSLTHAGNGVYNFTATLSVNRPDIIRVTANVISSSLTYSPATCGTAGPVNSYVTGAQNAGSFAASIPAANGREVIWHGPAANIGGLDFPIQIKFPPPSNLCSDYPTFCVKYTFTDRNCKTCEVIRCYGPFKRGGPIKTFDEIKDIKLKVTP
jgi:hypothetical protein